MKKKKGIIRRRLIRHEKCFILWGKNEGEKTQKGGEMKRVRNTQKNWLYWKCF